MARQDLRCPFCGHAEEEEHMMMYHIEVHHTEDSPFVAARQEYAASSNVSSVPAPAKRERRYHDDADDDGDNDYVRAVARQRRAPRDPDGRRSLLRAATQQSRSDHQYDNDGSDEGGHYVACTERDCGEVVLLVDLNEHLDLHLAESINSPDTTQNTSFSDEEQQGYSHITKTSRRINDDIAMQSSPYVERAEQSRGFGEDGPECLTPGGFEVGRFSTDISPALRHAAHASPAAAEDSSADSVLGTPSRSGRRRKRHHRRHESGDAKRQGKKELGPYAFEEQMPSWLWKKLSDGPRTIKKTRITKNGTLITQHAVENETAGIVPVLAQLSELDRDVREAYFCHPAVQHVFALPKEGGFCGYRNIQMLVGYLHGTKAFGYEKFAGPTPDIPKLQEMIEDAWDKGYNSICREQTGGILKTRKYIGTPEAQALFSSLKIPCVPEQCNPSGNTPAHQVLYDAVEAYFISGVSDHERKGRKVHKTVLPPLYLQMPGHSVTVVGLERRAGAARNLLVLDPMYKTVAALVNLIGRADIKSPHPMAIDSCRRGTEKLQRHKAFELLKLSSSPPRFPAWDVLAAFAETPYVYAFFDLVKDEYDVFPAHAFDRLFPWFMFCGLFVVREGRFARVAGDASFHRLGVPALGWDCDWEKWRLEKDIGPLVFAAQIAGRKQEAGEGGGAVGDADQREEKREAAQRMLQTYSDGKGLQHTNRYAMQIPKRSQPPASQFYPIRFSDEFQPPAPYSPQPQAQPAVSRAENIPPYEREPLQHDAAMATEGRCACEDCLTLLINRKARRSYYSVCRQSYSSSRSHLPPSSPPGGEFYAPFSSPPLPSAQRFSIGSNGSNRSFGARSSTTSMSRSTWMSQYSSPAAASALSSATSSPPPSRASAPSLTQMSVCSCWDCRAAQPFTPSTWSCAGSLPSLNSSLSADPAAHGELGGGTVVFPAAAGQRHRVADRAFSRDLHGSSNSSDEHGFWTPRSQCGCPAGWHTAFGAACSPLEYRYRTLTAEEDGQQQEEGRTAFQARSSMDGAASFVTDSYREEWRHGEGAFTRGQMGGVVAGCW